MPDQHTAVTFDGQTRVREHFFAGEFPTRDDDRFTATTMQLMRVKGLIPNPEGGFRGGGARLTDSSDAFGCDRKLMMFSISSISGGLICGFRLQRLCFTGL